MSLNMWMAKQTVVYPHNGILPSAKNKWAISPQKRHGGIVNADY